VTHDHPSPADVTLPDRDHQTLASIAGRLGKSPRWLQSRLTEDHRRPADHQRLQHHHYIGGSKR
jgi:hypothetical protein